MRANSERVTAELGTVKLKVTINRTVVTETEQREVNGRIG
jgi:hypothetical protein